MANFNDDLHRLMSHGSFVRHHFATIALPSLSEMASTPTKNKLNGLDRILPEPLRIDSLVATIQDIQATQPLK